VSGRLPCPSRDPFDTSRAPAAACRLALALAGTVALASQIDPSETQITLPDAIRWSGWINGFPPHSGEMATLYGGLDKSGPYLVLMKWYPGYMSAPHTPTPPIASRSYSPERGGLTAAPTLIRTIRFRFPPVDLSGASRGPRIMTE
jgi:hypothetical protein